MYRLSYKNPLEDGGWIVVATSKSKQNVIDMWSSIFWSAMERGLVTDPDEEFLRIEDLATGIALRGLFLFRLERRERLCGTHSPYFQRLLRTGIHD